MLNVDSITQRAIRSGAGTTDMSIVLSLNNAVGMVEMALDLIYRDDRGLAIHGDSPEVLERQKAELESLRDSYIALWSD